MAQKGETPTAKLRFLFTEKGFTLDFQEETATEEISGWKDRFETARYQALYDLGFEEKPSWLDAVGGFLYQTADQFQRWLTSQPDLELLREKIQLKPDEEIIPYLDHFLAEIFHGKGFTLHGRYVRGGKEPDGGEHACQCGQAQREDHTRRGLEGMVWGDMMDSRS